MKTTQMLARWRRGTDPGQRAVDALKQKEADDRMRRAVRGRREQQHMNAPYDVGGSF